MKELGTLIEELGDGLTLRRATAADADALAAYNSQTLTDDSSEPDPTVGVWTRDLMIRPHPTFHPELFTLVEDRHSGRIVSSLNLIPQTWTYDEIPFAVGRIELVSTDPAYRRRGLIRRQMAVVQRWSEAMGHLVQGITGIPWYYRQFGYEMTITLDPSATLPRDRIPQLPADETEPYRLRAATPADLPLIAELDIGGRRRWLVSCVRDATLWHYDLDGRSPDNAEGISLAVLETTASPAEPIGFVAYRPRLWWRGSRLALVAAEIAPDVSWLAAAPSLARALQAAGESLAPASESATTFAAVQLLLGPEHPLRQALAGRLVADERPYAWYIRVPDLPAFLRHVAPVLERRLAASAAANFSGELALGFYRDGIRLTFAAGKLTNVEPWPIPDRHAAGANFPPLTFLHLLFGYRSLAEVEYMCADCRVRQPEARLLLDALFPTRPSNIWPVA